MSDFDLFPETVVPHVPGPQRRVPRDFIDEITPPGRAHPNDWITWEGGETPIRIAWGDDEPEIVRDLAPGEFVFFAGPIGHGSVRFLLRSDGSWDTSRPIPSEANAFWQVGEPDTWGDSADEFARNRIENEWGGPDERSAVDPVAEVEIDVEMVECGTDEAFVLAIAPDGQPRFLPVADTLAANNERLEWARAAEQQHADIHAKGETFQSRVRPWLIACFGEAIAADRGERNHRFLEESLELVQSTGCTRSEAHQLVDYVFDRPAGDPPQEVGGVEVTLAALCLAHDIDKHAAAEAELARIWTKVEAIRAKQAAKPKHGPLPGRVRIVRHKKRGSTYRVVGTAMLQASEPVGEACAMVVYRAVDGGSLWVRPEAEFDDGRFEEVDHG